MLLLMLWGISRVPLSSLQVISQSLSWKLLSLLHVFVYAEDEDMIFHLSDT